MTERSSYQDISRSYLSDTHHISRSVARELPIEEDISKRALFGCTHKSLAISYIQAFGPK
jgi:hypothetical protein